MVGTTGLEPVTPACKADALPAELCSQPSAKNISYLATYLFYHTSLEMSILFYDNLSFIYCIINQHYLVIF